MTLVASVLLFRTWLGMLPRSVCPECGEPTLSVSHALSTAVGRWLSRRWCATCNWAGWGRKGPVLWQSKGPVADVSGFRWGEDRLQPNFGFRWRERRTTGQPVPIQHPSGFRFTQVPTDTPTQPDDPAHPSGFRFREKTSAAMPEGDHPSGFSWGTNGPRRQPGFRWKD